MTKNILPDILFMLIPTIWINPLIIFRIGSSEMMGKVIRSKEIMNKIIFIGRLIGIILETAQKNIIRVTMLRLMKNISLPIREIPVNISEIFALISLNGLGKGRNIAAINKTTPIILIKILRIKSI